MKQILFSGILLYAVMLCFSCNDDDIEDNFVELPPIETLDEQNARISSVITDETVLTNFIVTVVNTEFEIQSNTTITIGSTTKTTDENGTIVFENETVNKDFIFITATKEGYEKAMQTVIPSLNGITNVYIMLEANIPSVTFNGQIGGTLKTESTTLVFPEDAIINASGDLYLGTVTANIFYHALDNPNFEQRQPGILVGITDENESIGLVSEGMLTVELTDDIGNELNIATNKTVQISMPASVNGPNTITLWSLNETYGLWVEEGSATKKENVYEFEVRHFSTYNIDYKQADAIDFCVNIKDANGNPIANTGVNVIGTDTNIGRVYITDNIGQLCFRYAKPTTYSFRVDRCISSSTSIEVSSAITDYDVVINNTNEFLFGFSGTLTDCEGDLLTNNYFSITIEGITRIFRGYTDSFGKYNINGFLCDGNNTGIKEGVFVVQTSSSIITNDFPVDLSQPMQTINLSCGIVDEFPDDLVIRLGGTFFAEYLDRIGIPIINQNITFEESVTYGSIKNITELGYINGIPETSMFGNEGISPAIQYFTSLEKIGITVLFSDLTPFIGLENLQEIVIFREGRSEEEYNSAIERIQNELPNVTATLM